MTTRTLVIRSLDLAQAAPFLERAWNHIRESEPFPELWISNQPESQTTLPSASKVFSTIPPDKLPSNEYGSLISWSIPNERTLEDVSLATSDTTVVPGPLHTIYTLADKRATKGLLHRFGIPTPKSVVLDRGFIEGGLLSDNYKHHFEKQILSGLHFPLIVKPLWDCMGHGMVLVLTEEQLVSQLSMEGPRDLLVEEFHYGEAGSIEILGEPGDYQFQPPCWTGGSSEGMNADFDTLRVAHPDLFGQAFKPALKDKLRCLLDSLRFRGSCCVDFVVSNREVMVLEINPRVSGASCLSAAASGLDAFYATYEIAKSRWNKRHLRMPSASAAIQAGGTWATRVEEQIHALNIKVDWFRDENIVVDGVASRNVIIGAGSTDVETIVSALGKELP